MRIIGSKGEWRDLGRARGFERVSKKKREKERSLSTLERERERAFCRLSLFSDSVPVLLPLRESQRGDEVAARGDSMVRTYLDGEETAP